MNQYTLQGMADVLTKVAAQTALNPSASINRNTMKYKKPRSLEDDIKILKKYRRRMKTIAKFIQI
jgi:hypothetical protein